MSSARNTRSKKALPAPRSVDPTVSSSARAIRVLPRPTAPPTTNADKDALVDRFHALYDKCEIAKNDLLAARSKSSFINAGRAFDVCLVRNIPISLVAPR
jgi:hypothetical protein